MSISEETIEKLVELVKAMKIARRRYCTNREDQSTIMEFMRFKCYSESKKHKEIKQKIAKELKSNGKDVLVETTLYIGGMRIRPDICYFENNRWFIKEIECGFTHRNKILKNLDILKNHADIEILNVGKPEKEYYWV